MSLRIDTIDLIIVSLFATICIVKISWYVALYRIEKRKDK